MPVFDPMEKISMSAITELAKRLGKAIGDSPVAGEMRDARTAMEAEADLIKSVNDFQVQMEKVRKLEAEGKVIEVEDKHKLAELESVLTSSAVFKKYTAAQVEYIDMMRKVNEAIQAEIQGLQ